MKTAPYTIAQVMANLRIMANAGDSDSITWHRDVAASILARGICPAVDEVLMFKSKSKRLDSPKATSINGKAIQVTI